MRRVEQLAGVLKALPTLILHAAALDHMDATASDHPSHLAREMHRAQLALAIGDIRRGLQRYEEMPREAQA